MALPVVGTIGAVVSLAYGAGGKKANFLRDLANAVTGAVTAVFLAKAMVVDLREEGLPMVFRNAVIAGGALALRLVGTVSVNLS